MKRLESFDAHKVVKNHEDHLLKVVPILQSDISTESNVSNDVESWTSPKAETSTTGPRSHVKEFLETSDTKLLFTSRVTDRLSGDRTKPIEKVGRANTRQLGTGAPGTEAGSAPFLSTAWGTKVVSQEKTRGSISKAEAACAKASEPEVSIGDTKMLEKKPVRRTASQFKRLLTRPNFKEGHSTKQIIHKDNLGKPVDLSVRLLRISEVKDELQSYYCEILMFQLWIDPTLIGAKRSGINWKNQWGPRMTIVNLIRAVDDYFSPRELSKPVLINPKIGQVLHVQKINGTYSNSFHLKDFPFDMQCFLLVFRSKDSFDKVYIRRMRNPAFKSAVAKDFASSLSHWRVQTWCQEAAEVDTVSLNRPYAIYKVTIFAERKPGYYINKMVSIMVITTIMSILAFAIPLREIGSRLEFLVSILLTNITFSLSINDQLPKIGYYTQLDKFFQISLLAPFAISISSSCWFYTAREKIVICDERVGADVSASAVYPMTSDNDSEIYFNNLQCDYKDDQWVLIGVCIFYLLVYCHFWYTYKRITGRNKQRLERAQKRVKSSISGHIGSPSKPAKKEVIEKKSKTHIETFELNEAPGGGDHMCLSFKKTRRPSNIDAILRASSTQKVLSKLFSSTREATSPPP